MQGPKKLVPALTAGQILAQELASLARKDRLAPHLRWLAHRGRPTEAGNAPKTKWAATTSAPLGRVEILLSLSSPLLQERLCSHQAAIGLVRRFTIGARAARKRCGQSAGLCYRTEREKGGHLPFLPHGAAAFRAFQRVVVAAAAQVLAWFHIAMRFKNLKHIAEGLNGGLVGSIGHAA